MIMKAFAFFTSLLLALMLTAGGWSATSSPAAAEDPAALAQRIQARYQQVNSLAADYTRTSRFVALADQPGRQVKGSGRLLWARPLRLRLEQDRPRQEMILVLEARAWWLRPDRQQADLYALESFTSGLTSLLQALGGLGYLQRDFSVDAPDPALAAGGPAGALSLVLTPRQRRADLKQLVLWFNGDTLLLAGFKIINLVGDVTSYRLGSPKVNVPVNDELFSFSPPQGWQVVDHRPRSAADEAQGR